MPEDDRSRRRGRGARGAELLVSTRLTIIVLYGRGAARDRIDRASRRVEGHTFTKSENSLSWYTCGPGRRAVAARSAPPRSPAPLAGCALQSAVRTPTMR